MEDKGTELGEAHWTYIEQLLKVHGEDEKTIEKIKFHYIQAMKHGYKHGLNGHAQEGFKYDNEMLKPNISPPEQGTIKEPIINLRGKRYVNVIDKWIKNNNIKRFKIDDYIKGDVGRIYQRKRINKYLSSMIADNTLLQVSNNEFIVKEEK